MREIDIQRLPNGCIDHAYYRARAGAIRAQMRSRIIRRVLTVSLRRRVGASVIAAAYAALLSMPYAASYALLRKGE